MAEILELAPKIVKWEGGFVNDPLDRGGATNMGITLATWKQVGYDKDGDGDIDSDDIRRLSLNDFARVLRLYWNRWQADKIKNQSIASILVDWVWGSGKWGIVIPQRIMGLNADGSVGSVTITKLNQLIDKDAEGLFNAIYAARVKFLNDIVARDPSQNRFLKGWKARLADFKFSPK